jgi:hypothetical protein
VSRPGAKEVGAFLTHQTAELTRIWRLARAAERTGVAPGLLDGLLASFFAEAGAALAEGRAPGDAFARAVGLVRWPPARAPAEHHAVGAIGDEVLRTSADSVNAAPSVAEWLRRAVEAARDATRALDAGRGPVPAGVLVLLDFTPPRPPAPRAESAA